MDLKTKIALYHARIERKHADRKRLGHHLKSAKWALKWDRRAERFSGRRTMSSRASFTGLVEKPEETIPLMEKMLKEKPVEPIAETIVGPVEPVAFEAKKPVKTKKPKARKAKIKKPTTPKKKIKRITVKEPVDKIFEKKPVEEEKPKIEKGGEEKKLGETTTLIGHFTEISMPKTKEEKEFDWSARRFKELEEKLKKLRKF